MFFLCVCNESDELNKPFWTYCSTQVTSFTQVRTAIHFLLFLRKPFFTPHGMPMLQKKSLII
jgi:hypothetical protein